MTALVLPLEQRTSCTVQEARAYTGISEARIYELLKDRTLEGTMVRGRWLVMVPSFLRLLHGDRAEPEGSRAA